MEGHRIYIGVARHPECAGCQAQSVCTTTNGKEQLVEVTDCSGTFHTGETVLLEEKNAMGRQAVFLAFLLPLALLVATILIATGLHLEEGGSALAGLLALFLYYIILYFFRNALKNKFVFTIKKIDSE